VSGTPEPIDRRVCAKARQLLEALKRRPGESESALDARYRAPITAELATEFNELASAGEALFRRSRWIRGKRAIGGVTEMGDVLCWVTQMRDLSGLPEPWSALVASLYNEDGNHAYVQPGVHHLSAPTDVRWLIGKAEEAAAAINDYPIATLLDGETRGLEFAVGSLAAEAYLHMDDLDLPNELDLLERFAKAYSAILPGNRDERAKLRGFVVDVAKQKRERDLYESARAIEREHGLPRGMGDQIMRGGCCGLVAGAAVLVVAAGALLAVACV